MKMEAVLPSQEEQDGAVRLPVHGTTVTAEDLRVRLVLAADLNDVLEVDASEVESVGQAVLQLLVAARVEAASNGQTFRIVYPSQAFAERVTSIHLAHAVGLDTGEAL